MTGGWLIRIAPEVVSVEEESDVLPQVFTLYQNHPNPFNPLTTIEYPLPQSGDVSFIIYNLLGEKLTSLVRELQPAGNHQVIWNASNVSSGIYLYRLQAGPPAGGFLQTKKMVLLR